MFCGVDPGSKDGALACLSSDGRSIVALSAFVEVAGGYRVNTAALGSVSVAEVAGLSEVGEAWRASLEAQPAPENGTRIAGLVVEDLFANRDNPQSVIPLAEACGALTYPLHRHAAKLHRLLSTQWRPEQLGPGRRTASQWEAWAISRAERAFPEFAALTAGWSKAQRGAAAEAVWMARAAYVRRGRA